MKETQKLERWLSNIFNSALPNAERYLTYSISAYQNGGAAMKRERKRHLDWVNRNLKGPPKETKKYSVKELSRMGLIGIYTKPL